MIEEVIVVKAIVTYLWGAHSGFRTYEMDQAVKHQIAEHEAEKAA